MSDVAARRPTELCEAGAAKSGKTRNWIVIPAKAHCCPGYFLPMNETRWAASLCCTPRGVRLDLDPPPRHPRESGDPGVWVRRTTLDPRVRGSAGALFERWWIQRIYSGQQCAFARMTERCGKAVA
jgi:hypothetical protein